MANVPQICGFERNGTEEIFETSGTYSFQSSVKRTGGYALQINPTTTNTGWVSIRGVGSGAGIDLPTAYYRFYFYIGTLPAANNEEFCVIEPGPKLCLRITSDGYIQAYDTTGTTQLGSDGTTQLTTGKWYRIEVKCGTGNPAAYEIKIDGNSELSGTGNLGGLDNYKFVFGKKTNRNGQSVNFYYDDFYVDGTGFPGAGQCEMMQPDGDGNYTTWTIGAGSGDKWQQLDESPNDGDTSYLLSTLTVDNAYTAAMESASSAGISGTVKAVKAAIIVKADTGTSSVRLRLRSGTTDSDSLIASIGGVYSEVSGGFAIDPNTSAAWTVSALNGIEIGGVEGENIDKTRLSAIYAMVDFWSGSPSVSPSASESPSVSPSASASLSVSPSSSLSPSASVSPSTPPIQGDTCWGHDTDVLETNVRDFSGNWTGTGAISGSGDDEVIKLEASEYMESEVVDTGDLFVTLLQNVYKSGDTVTLKYRHGATEATCLAASWNAYSGVFQSLGYVQIRLESTL